MTNFTATLTLIQRVGGLDSDLELPAYAWPGGYPMYYLTAQGTVLCAKHANVEGEFNDETLTEADVNWEDTDLWCEHSHKIESAYGDDDGSLPEVERCARCGEPMSLEDDDRAEIAVGIVHAGCVRPGEQSA